MCLCTYLPDWNYFNLISTKIYVLFGKTGKFEAICFDMFEPVGVGVVVCKNAKNIQSFPNIYFGYFIENFKVIKDSRANFKNLSLVFKYFKKMNF